MSVFGDHAPDGQQNTDRFFLFHRHDSNDVNNKILLSAIITVSAVLFLVILLHIYARFLLRRRLSARGLPTSILSVAAGSPTGLPPSAIAALPVITVQKASDGDGGGYGECAVCLSALEVGEPARLLPNCNHAFHVQCIDMWLGSHSTCPICRADVEPAAAPILPLSREPPAAPACSQSPGKVGGPSSRLSSLRRMMSGEIPTRRVQHAGQEDQDVDVESQSQRQ